jgi:hypothetical protein
MYQNVTDPQHCTKLHKSIPMVLELCYLSCGLEERRLPAVAPLLTLLHLGRNPRTFLPFNDSFPLILSLIHSFLFVSSWLSFFTYIRTVFWKFCAVFHKRGRRFVIFANCRQFGFYSTHGRRFRRPLVWLPSQLLVLVNVRALVTEKRRMILQDMVFNTEKICVKDHGNAR